MNGVRQKFAEQFEVFPSGTCSREGIPRHFSWYDLVGLATLTKDLVARLEVVEVGTQNHYPALRLKIVSKVHGEIDSKLFIFNDYLSPAMVNRSDTREDRPGNFYAWCHGGHGSDFDWYIATPKTLEPLLTAIREYILTWTEAG